MNVDNKYKILTKNQWILMNDNNNYILARAIS